MGKITDNIKIHLKTYIIVTIASLIVGAIIFCLYFFLKEKTLVAALDGTGMAGVILLGAGLLCILSRFGAFDTMSYGFKQLFTSMFAKEANKYHDMVEYKEEQDKKRKTSSHYYVPMMLVSLLFFLAFIALEIYKTQLY